jgi:hypothetical protein
VLRHPFQARVNFGALVGSALPVQLTGMGYIVEKTGESQRILPHAVAQRFEVSSSGALVPPTEGSTKPTKRTDFANKLRNAANRQRRQLARSTRRHGCDRLGNGSSWRKAPNEEAELVRIESPPHTL